MVSVKSENRGINIFVAFIRMLPRFVRVSPLFFVCWQSLSLLHGFSYGIIAPIAQRFFDSAANYASQETEIQTVIASLSVLGLAHAIKQILNGTANFMYNMYMRKSEGTLSLAIHEKISRISPIDFEDSKVLDNISKADKGKDRTAWFMGSCLLTFNFYIPYFCCMAIYLLTVKPLLVISLPLVFAPTLLTQILRAKIFAKVEDKAAPLRRELDYYERCITGREYFKETRVLGAFSYFIKLYKDTLLLMNKLTFRALVKSDLAELGMKLLSLGGYTGILILLFNSLINGEISVGAFAAIFGSVDRIFSIMEEMIVQNYGESARNFGMIQNYLGFLQMPERESGDIELVMDTDISLQCVSLTYPGAGQKAVDNVTLTIRPGETVAVVGENGSGKTTLIRLITGLYLPDNGDVMYGEVNTKEVSSHCVTRNISAVFQKYQQYQMTLRENIGISDFNREADDCTLDNVCAEAGVDKNDGSFPYGYETMLSREFDGVNISGGQWQRVAIARSFFRSHQFIVLDEPTAAIDPIEETKVYKRFAEISKGKTALIVTHRLGSVKLADRIFVMKHGRLVEQGTHIELMSSNGEYTRLYKSQEQWYTV